MGGVPIPRSNPRAAFLAACFRVSLASTAVLLGACDGDQDECTPGYETCSCAADARCLSGLQCLSNRCVDPNFSPDENEGPDTAASGSEGESEEGFDNAVACEALLDSFECAPPGGLALLDCASFDSSPCDISDYFECLADNTTCSGDQLDASGWTQCLDLAVCS